MLGCFQQSLLPIEWSGFGEVLLKPLALALGLSAGIALMTPALTAPDHEHSSVGEALIQSQREALARSTSNQGFGPQSPRDLNQVNGLNQRVFMQAPPRTELNLCNIHFHASAEHKGGEFTTYAGPGDGKGAGTGYRYNGPLTAAELRPVPSPVGQGNYGDLKPGDTIEVHYVHSSAKVKPGPGLGSCVSPSINNPQLRVETIVAVLVNDSAAADFQELNAIKRLNGFYQATGLPEDLGEPVTYAGSTTGPSYNEQGSLFQVTWNVRPRVLKVDIASVDRWLKNNPFEETAAHGVRNLVQNQKLLSPIR